MHGETLKKESFMVIQAVFYVFIQPR